MGAQQSVAARSARRKAIQTKTMPAAAIPEKKMTEAELMELLPHMMGDNGPGDSFVGSFIDEYEAVSGKVMAQSRKDAILGGRRFHICKSNKAKHLSALIDNNGMLYVVQVTPRKSLAYCFRLTSGSRSKLMKKWAGEHMRKTCAR